MESREISDQGAREELLLCMWFNSQCCFLSSLQCHQDWTSSTHWDFTNESFYCNDKRRFTGEWIRHERFDVLLFNFRSFTVYFSYSLCYKFIWCIIVVVLLSTGSLQHSLR